MLGAGRVIAIDEVPERLAMAEAGGAETIDFSKKLPLDHSEALLIQQRRQFFGYKAAEICDIADQIDKFNYSNSVALCRRDSGFYLPT